MFHGCWQIPEKNNVEEERLIWAHVFRDFNVWLARYEVETSCRRVWWGEAAKFVRAKMKSKWEMKGPGTCWVTYFLQPCPPAYSFHHILVVHSDYPSVKWIRCGSELSWSKHLQKPQLWTMLFWQPRLEHMRLWGTFQIQIIQRVPPLQKETEVHQYCSLPTVIRLVIHKTAFEFKQCGF